MRPTLVLVVVLSGAVTGCGGGAPQKTVGPAINSLSIQQLGEVQKTCQQYHDPTDARVPYTIEYCAQVESAWDSRPSLSSAPATSKVDAAH